ncbi:hypothetical protein FPANT_2420 [Fusarium pseudoanthophilum]|uniref:Uncharacterized protein n=1 Tax=Fusarium pseudoanthophilum TaxID=48495 RepID=A0A8H5PP02_9HYPO|nr:hypothetical protein FPANT_2420 [Fusarium pseudoanthophilum]
MDPFNSLPPEIRLKILFSITSKFSLASITRASPTMLRQYQTQRNKIRLNIISIDLDEEMVQDALAIIQFPRERGVQEHKLLHVRDHLKRWVDKNFVSPLTTQDDYLFEHLDDLHSMLLHFIQDYCSKATASYMPREYICLQGVQSPSPTTQLYFRGQPITTSFNPDSLTPMELKRFLRAFLLYELNCKVAEFLGTSPNPGSPLNNLPKRAIHPSEDDAIHCVHTYVRSLYGACIAQRDDGFLPSGPDGSEFEVGLAFPDSFCFDPDLYTGDRGLRGNHHGDVTSHLAKSGLETITQFTRYRFRTSWDNHEFNQELDSVMKSLSRRMGPYQHVVTRVEPSDDACSPMYDRLSDHITRSNTIQLRIYQQRAWVFFDNNRLYPPATHSRPRFPTQDFLFREADRLIRVNGVLEEYSELTRGKLRSQKWQDEYATRKRELAYKDEIRQLREENTILRSDRQQTNSGNPQLSVPAFEDPTVLREEAKRLIDQHIVCDLATVAKYLRYTPPWTYIYCRQPPRCVHIPASFNVFGNKTVAEIELFLDTYLGLQKEKGRLDREEPIDFCFGIW